SLSSYVLLYYQTFFMMQLDTCRILNFKMPPLMHAIHSILVEKANQKCHLCVSSLLTGPLGRSSVPRFTSLLLTIDF
ncbi:hypothetical protein HMI54_011199, partial [Coelomomyces lativittatus]